MSANPYSKLPAQAYWRTGVARHSGRRTTIPKLWTPSFEIVHTDKFLTVGSCFAQHIGKALEGAGLHRMIVEKAPAILPQSMHAQFGYGIFSFRFGNVYTTSMLLQWLRWMQDQMTQDREVWHDGTAFFDPVRPCIEPGGFETEQDLFDARHATFEALRKGISEADVFIFTLGLTEMWLNSDTGLVYASCPGTQAGAFDAEKHVFKNSNFSRTLADLKSIYDILAEINPSIKMLLTVSPVPLTATAAPNSHVLVSTVYSKSILRAAAGEMATELDAVDYFPSYELVSHPAIGFSTFESDRREVTAEAVAFVMQHFLDGIGLEGKNPPHSEPSSDSELIAQRIEEALVDGDAICDDIELDKYNEN